MGDYHVRFCERFGVKFPLPTRQKNRWKQHKNEKIMNKIVRIHEKVLDQFIKLRETNSKLFFAPRKINNKNITIY